MRAHPGPVAKKSMINWSEKLPSQVKGRAVAAGEAGKKWLLELDGIIESLEKDWNIRIMQVLAGGSHAFVGLAETQSGEAVLKIEVPDCPADDFIRSATVLRFAGGNGYCRLHAMDIPRRAALLQRLGEPLRLSEFSPEKQMRIICRAMCKSWGMDFFGEELPVGNHFWFREFIPSAWEELGRPCPKSVVERSLEYISDLERRTKPDEYVLVHGDAHNNNMLRVPGTDEYLFIDPDGLVFEKSYDVGVLMREWPDEYLSDPVGEGRARCRFLSDITGVPDRDIWQWGFLQMTATALILIQIGDFSLGEKMLALSEAWLQVR